MRKIILFLCIFSIAFGGGSEQFTGGVKPSGKVILENEYEKSAQIFKESCTKGHAYNCYNLAEFYKKGLGVIKSDENALKYYQISCDLKLPYGCFKVANIALESGDDKKALRDFTASCDFGDDMGCLWLSKFYENSDKQKSKNYAQKACQMGNDSACASLK